MELTAFSEIISWISNAFVFISFHDVHSQGAQPWCNDVLCCQKHESFRTLPGVRLFFPHVEINPKT